MENQFQTWLKAQGYYRKEGSLVWWKNGEPVHGSELSLKLNEWKSLMNKTGVSENALINNDISRCNDYGCPTNFCCARFRQLRFDKENGNNQFSVIDFEGRTKNGLCDHFINID